MRLKFIGKPSEVKYVALSGGLDSMALLAFLRKGGHKPEAIYVNHRTDHGSKAEEFVTEHCRNQSIVLHKQSISNDIPLGVSKEEWWRDQRYKILGGFQGTIATAQHLTDQVETYLMGCLTGTPKVMPYRRGNIVRPFLLNSRKNIQIWAESSGLKWIEDPSNQDDKYKRNAVRLHLLPAIAKVTPGLETVVRKKVLLHSDLP